MLLIGSRIRCITQQAGQQILEQMCIRDRDITESLKAGGGTLLFYETENRQRTMYLGFDRSMAGLPFSLYFDIENYGDRPVRFRTEYLTEQGFLPVRTEDYTEGFCGSGNLLLMIPQDAVRRKLYGYEGYFIRFINENKENPEYELPLIRGIYPNMVRVVNVDVYKRQVPVHTESMREELRTAPADTEHRYREQGLSLIHI